MQIEGSSVRGASPSYLHWQSVCQPRWPVRCISVSIETAIALRCDGNAGSGSNLNGRDSDSGILRFPEWTVERESARNTKGLVFWFVDLRLLMRKEEVVKARWSASVWFQPNRNGKVHSDQPDAGALMSLFSRASVAFRNPFTRLFAKHKI